MIDGGSLACRSGIASLCSIHTCTRFTYMYMNVPLPVTFILHVAVVVVSFQRVVLVPVPPSYCVGLGYVTSGHMLAESMTGGIGTPQRRYRVLFALFFELRLCLMRSDTAPKTSGCNGKLLGVSRVSVS
jgi:hypothetical protein